MQILFLYVFVSDRRGVSQLKIMYGRQWGKGDIHSQSLCMDGRDVSKQKSMYGRRGDGVSLVKVYLLTAGWGVEGPPAEVNV